jgi:radical SAM protein with 4Fe4S-binding SPASM domain
MDRCLPNLDPQIVRILWRRRSWRKLVNFALVELQMGLKSTRSFAKPYWLTIDPTNFCQLRCPFCPTGAERKVRAKAILKMDDYRRVLDELGPTLLHIDFMNWGEPLLHPHLFDMIAYAKKFDVDTLVSTNFNDFDEEAAEKMVLSGLDAVILSIDGLTQKTYEKYRVRGDYDKVIRNLKLLVKKKKELGRSNPYIIWQFLVFKHNEHEAEKVREFAKDLGVDTVGVTPAFLPFRPGIKDEWLPTKPEYRHYDPETFPDTPPWEWSGEGPAPADRKPESESNGSPAGGNGHAGPAPSAPAAGHEGGDEPISSPANGKKKWDLTLALLKFFERRSNGQTTSESKKAPSGASPEIDVKVYQEPEKRPLCVWPWAGITVNPNGSVSPCCSVEEDMYDFGNIFQDGFKKIWNNPDYLRSRRHVRDYVEHRADVITRSNHACERCFSVGRANFTFQPWWRFEQYEWWWAGRSPRSESPKDPS